VTGKDSTFFWVIEKCWKVREYIFNDIVDSDEIIKFANNWELNLVQGCFKQGYYFGEAFDQQR
jgi:hypothetical protein